MLLITDFEDYLKSIGIKESSMKKYLGTIQQIPSDIMSDANKINFFLSERNREYNDATMYYAVIRHYLRMINRYDILRKIKYPRIKRLKRVPTYLEISEVYKILDNIAQENYKVAGYVQLFGGMRSFEVMSIKRKDISMLNDMFIIVVRSAKRDPYESVIVGKGYEVLINYLNRHEFHDDQLVFAKKTNSRDIETMIRTNTRYYQQAIRDSAKELGYIFRSHDLKRNLARYLRYEKNLAIEEVKEALHHSKIETTMRYVGKVNRDRIISALKTT